MKVVNNTMRNTAPTVISNLRGIYFSNQYLQWESHRRNKCMTVSTTTIHGYQPCDQTLAILTHPPLLTLHHKLQCRPGNSHIDFGTILFLHITCLTECTLPRHNAHHHIRRHHWTKTTDTSTQTQTQTARVVNTPKYS